MAERSGDTGSETPRSIDFVAALSRHPNPEDDERLLRDPHRQRTGRKI